MKKIEKVAPVAGVNPGPGTPVSKCNYHCTCDNHWHHCVSVGMQKKSIK